MLTSDSSHDCEDDSADQQHQTTERCGCEYTVYRPTTVKERTKAAEEPKKGSADSNQAPLACTEWSGVASVPGCKPEDAQEQADADRSTSNDDNSSRGVVACDRADGDAEDYKDCSPPGPSIHVYRSTSR